MMSALVSAGQRCHPQGSCHYIKGEPANNCPLHTRNICWFLSSSCCSAVQDVSGENVTIVCGGCVLSLGRSGPRRAQSGLLQMPCFLLPAYTSPGLTCNRIPADMPALQEPVPLRQLVPSSASRPVLLCVHPQPCRGQTAQLHLDV